MARYWLMNQSAVGIDDVLAMPNQTVDWWAYAARRATSCATR